MRKLTNDYRRLAILVLIAVCLLLYHDNRRQDKELENLHIQVNTLAAVGYANEDDISVLAVASGGQTMLLYRLVCIIDIMQRILSGPPMEKKRPLPPTHPSNLT